MMIVQKIGELLVLHGEGGVTALNLTGSFREGQTNLREPS
jgi:hypothetical protein